MGPLGIPELIVIGIIALLVFGPRKLPELGRTVGKALSEFRRASLDIRSTLEEEVKDLERQTADAKRAAEDAVLPREEAADSGYVEPPETPAAGETSPEEKPADGHNERA